MIYLLAMPALLLAACAGTAGANAAPVEQAAAPTTTTLAEEGSARQMRVIITLRTGETGQFDPSDVAYIQAWLDQHGATQVERFEGLPTLFANVSERDLGALRALDAVAHVKADGLSGPH